MTIKPTTAYDVNQDALDFMARGPKLLLIDNQWVPATSPVPIAMNPNPSPYPTPLADAPTFAEGFALFLRARPAICSAISV